MVGLDAAGKTTILYKLKLGEGESFLSMICHVPTPSPLLLTSSLVSLLHTHSCDDDSHHWL